MTKSSFVKTNGVITSFISSGHTDFANHGEDIVCSAISSAIYLVANTIIEIYGIDVRTSTKDGFFSLKLKLEDAVKCNEVLEGLLLHLKNLNEDYPDFMSVSVIENDNNNEQ